MKKNKIKELPKPADVALLTNFGVILARPELAKKIKEANPKAFAEFMRRGKAEAERVAKLAKGES